MEHFFIIVIQITYLSRSNEKIAAPPARRPAGAPGAPRRLQRALCGGPAVSSFPGARAPGYFSLALCKQDNLPRPKGAQITIVSQTNIRHAKPPEAGEGPLSRRGVGGCGAGSGGSAGLSPARTAVAAAPLFAVVGELCPLPAAGRGTPGNRSHEGSSAENFAPSREVLPGLGPPFFRLLLCT